MDFLVRPYDPTDRDRVAQLAERLTTGVAEWRSQDKVAAAVGGWVQESTEQRDSEHAMWVAVEHEFVVDADRVGRGVGRALVGSAEQWAADRRLQRIRLTTGAANHGALHMYESLGYVGEEVTLSRAVVFAD